MPSDWGRQMGQDFIQPLLGMMDRKREEQRQQAERQWELQKARIDDIVKDMESGTGRYNPNYLIRALQEQAALAGGPKLKKGWNPGQEFEQPELNFLQKIMEGTLPMTEGDRPNAPEPDVRLQARGGAAAEQPQMGGDQLPAPPGHPGYGEAQPVEGAPEGMQRYQADQLQGPPAPQAGQQIIDPNSLPPTKTHLEGRLGRTMAGANNALAMGGPLPSRPISGTAGPRKTGPEPVMRTPEQTAQIQGDIAAIPFRSKAASVDQLASQGWDRADAMAAHGMSRPYPGSSVADRTGRPVAGSYEWVVNENGEQRPAIFEEGVGVVDAFTREPLPEGQWRPDPSLSGGSRSTPWPARIGDNVGAVDPHSGDVIWQKSGINLPNAMESPPREAPAPVMQQDPNVIYAANAKKAIDEAVAADLEADFALQAQVMRDPSLMQQLRDEKAGTYGFDSYDEVAVTAARPQESQITPRRPAAGAEETEEFGPPPDPNNIVEGEHDYIPWTKVSGLPAVRKWLAKNGLTPEDIEDQESLDASNGVRTSGPYMAMIKHLIESGIVPYPQPNE